MKGKFITFEGSEGCGKSTQSRLLYAYLKSRGFNAVYLREPGGTKISEKIRRILLDSNNDSMSSVCEVLLYMASRNQLVNEVIKPALREDKSVICDRFLDSTFAYQGYGLGIDIDFIKKIGRAVTGGMKPDLTILLDLPVEKGLLKRGRIKDRIEQRSYEYHKRVREGYLVLARQEPRRIKVVKVANKKSVTQDKIRSLVLGLFKKDVI